MNRITVSLIFISLLMASCSESENNTQAQGSTEKVSIASKTQGKSCLEEYQAEPWTLFSLEEIAKFAKLPAVEGTMQEPMKTKKLSYRAVGYKWDTGRTMIFSSKHTGEMKLPVSDTITIGSFSILDPEKTKVSFVDYFNNKYRKPTAEEQAQFDKAFARQLEKESDLTKAVGKGFAGLASQIDYQSIDGIGDAASWETNPKSPDGNLHVLHKNMTFVVIINLNDDRDYNLGIAKIIAAAIVEKCDS